MENLTGMAFTSTANVRRPPDESYTAAGYEIRPATEADAESICTLFGKIFPDEMTPTHWRWKYLREQSRAIVACRNGKLVAHYGGVGTNILIEGEPSTAIQVTDLMVDPSERHAVRRNSPFFLTASAFLDSYAGTGNPFCLGYGFPSDRAMVLSDRLGLFTPVGSMHEMSWNIPQSVSSPGNNVIEINAGNYPGYAEKMNKLWTRFSRQFHNHFICIKDADFIRWRYLDHPSKRYAIYLVRGRITRKPKFLLVMRHDGDKSLLMDILGDSLDLQPATKIAIQITRQAGKAKMVTWCSDSFITIFQATGAQGRTLPVAIPANTWSPGPPPASQKGKWWFMPGDTDYL